MRPRDPQKQGTTQTSLQPPWRIPMIRHSVHAVMSSQKTLHDLFQPSTTKSSQTSSSGQKRKPDKDPQEILGPKKRIFFLPNGLNKFNLLTCFLALPPCNYYTNTCLQTHTRKSLSYVGTLKKEKGPSVSRKWRSQ